MHGLWIVLLIGLLAACGTPPPNPSVIDPTILSWERSPDAIVFRADVIGGVDDFRARSEIAPCTVYGDQRVVWVNELSGFNVEILYDAVSGDELRDFIRYLTVEEAIYTFGWRYDELFATAEVAPVVETVTLAVNDTTHRTDSLSGWDAELFTRVLTLCKRLGAEPILFEPDGGWLSGRRVAYSPQSPISTWDAARMGLSLPGLEGDSPRWVTGAALLTVWEALLSLPSSLLYTEDYAAYYQVALQIPGITRESPPAP